VGEVNAEIDNPGREIPPGANLNARLRAENVENALAVPKEALRRDSSGFGVYVLEDGRIAWRAVEVGVSGLAQTQILSGLKDGDLVALPGDAPIRPGLAVTPLVP
jgi:multidrug efflux pump subunit AcrA (membrane-fusion protein)